MIKLIPDEKELAPAESISVTTLAEDIIDECIQSSVKGGTTGITANHLLIRALSINRQAYSKRLHSIYIHRLKSNTTEIYNQTQLIQPNKSYLFILNSNIKPKI